MLSRPCAWNLVFLIMLPLACKTASTDKSQQSPSPIQNPSPIEPEQPPARADAPSVHYRGTGDLVVPGSDEVLVNRGPNARCPSSKELDNLEKVIVSLGEETVDLVREDLANLRQTLQRSEPGAIASCCNQLEQLVQDVEIMNEEKPSAVKGVDSIRNATQKICPSAL